MSLPSQSAEPAIFFGRGTPDDVGADAVVLFLGGGVHNFLNAAGLEQFLVILQITDGLGAGHHLVRHLVEEIHALDWFLAALLGEDTADALHRLVQQIVVALEAADIDGVVDQLDRRQALLIQILAEQAAHQQARLGLVKIVQLFADRRILHRRDGDRLVGAPRPLRARPEFPWTGPGPR
jgi:hypothetical protein